MRSSRPIRSSRRTTSSTSRPISTGCSAAGAACGACAGPGLAAPGCGRRRRAARDQLVRRTGLGPRLDGRGTPPDQLGRPAWRSISQSGRRRRGLAARTLLAPDQSRRRPGVRVAMRPPGRECAPGDEPPLPAAGSGPRSRRRAAVAAAAGGVKMKSVPSRVGRRGKSGTGAGRGDASTLAWAAGIVAAWCAKLRTVLSRRVRRCSIRLPDGRESTSRPGSFDEMRPQPFDARGGAGGPDQAEVEDIGRREEGRYGRRRGLHGPRRRTAPPDHRHQRPAARASSRAPDHGRERANHAERQGRPHAAALPTDRRRMP